MASLMLVRNVVGELQPKRTLAASRGFLAAARLSCFEIGLLGPKRIGGHDLDFQIRHRRFPNLWSVERRSHSS